MIKFENNLDFAKHLDDKDVLKKYRDRFYIPMVNGKESIYFTGNSLGLQPKTTQDYVLNELEDWANYGVEGHLHSRNPWLDYHEIFTEPLAALLGAKETEVVAMNQLTVNLHLLLLSFYRPSKQRYKIICEAKAFPSDQYCLESQVTLHGFKKEEAIIEVAPRAGEHTIRLEDILAAIEEHKNELALVFIGGVNYYSGQVFNMGKIAAAAHEAGAYAGFDLAHAVGNIELNLNDWQVDFASWCSYKYLNSGPGGVSGIYINEKFATDKNFPRMAGWWGTNKKERFEMKPEFDAIPSAEGWQLSNAPVLSLAAHKAALDIFTEAGAKNIYEKGKQLSSYLMFVLEEINANAGENLIEIITPVEDKGCQVSMLMLKEGKRIFDALKKHGVIADWREPNVIRVAPVALYNSFEDVFNFGRIIEMVKD